MSSDARQYVIGVDLGGTNIGVGTLSVDGSELYGHLSEETPVDSGPTGVADHIHSMIERSMGKAAGNGVPRDAILGIGVGAPGPLDRAHGVVIVAPNLGWRNFPLRDEISRRTNLPVTLDNDANCATLGEWWQGAARGGRHVIGLTIGTGIGGGLILDGQLFHGASDVAGEIGHTTIESNGRLCKCGNYGCLEAYASGTAIAARAREALDVGDASILPSLVDFDLSRITSQTVYDAATRGDAVALEVVRQTARFLGIGVSNLLNIFNPDVVVVAGGVTRAGEALFEPLRAEVKRRAFRPAVDACRIVPGVLPGTAGVVGAVATFKAQHLDLA